jgi:hypothetical protein
LEEGVPAAQPESGAFLVVLHPALDLVWSPPPALAACFDSRVIETTRERYHVEWGEFVAWSPIKLTNWSEIRSPGLLIRGQDPRVDLMNELFDECAVAAKLADADVGVGYEVRGGVRRDGSARVSVSAAYGPDLDERMRCCLVKTGESLVASLRLGEELRYEGGPHGHGGTLIRPNIE